MINGWAVMIPMRLFMRGCLTNLEPGRAPISPLASLLPLLPTRAITQVFFVFCSDQRDYFVCR